MEQVKRIDVEDLVCCIKDLESYLRADLKQKLEEARRNPEAYNYGVSVKALFDLSESDRDKVSEWEGAVRAASWPEFKSIGGPKEFPIDFSKPVKEGWNKFSITASFTERFSNHQPTMESLLTKLYTIVSVKPVQAADMVAEVTLNKKEKMGSVVENRILHKDIKTTTNFGAMARLTEENLGKAKAHYSDEGVKTAIFNHISLGNSAVECFAEDGPPYMIRYEGYDKDGNPIPLKYSFIDDIVQKVEGFEYHSDGKTETYHAASFFFPIQRRNSPFPNFGVIETDMGDLVRFYNPEQAGKWSASVEQEIITEQSNAGIKAAYQYSGSAGFHNIFRIESEDGNSPKKYLEALDKMRWRGEKERSLFAFSRIFTEVVGYKVSKSKRVKDLGNIVSIDPKRKIDRSFKILVDPSVNMLNGVIRAPTSLHTSSGNCCARICVDSGLLPEFCYDYHQLRTFSEPQTVRRHVNENPDLYLLPPQNPISVFNRYVDRNFREFCLMIWLRKKIKWERRLERAYPKDNVLTLGEGEVECILSHYL